jgi:hypothetical protein
MRLALLLLCACVSPKTPSPPSTITVVPPKVSRVAIVRRHTIQKMAVPALPGQNAGGQNVETHSETEETVAAVNGLAITKLLIHITRDDRAAQVASGVFPLPGMAGKKLELSYDGKVSITPPLSAADDDDIRDRYRLLGQPDPFLAHAPTGALALKARVPEYEEAFRIHFARKSETAEAHVSSAEVINLGTATFEVHLTIDGMQHRFNVHGTFDGKLTVDPETGWVRTFVMNGKFRGTAPEAAGELIGEHLNEVVYAYR